MIEILFHAPLWRQFTPIHQCTVMQSEKELMVVISCAAWKWDQTFAIMFILEGRSRPWKTLYFVSRHSIKLKTFSQTIWTIRKQSMFIEIEFGVFLNMGEMFWLPMATGSIMIWVSLMSKNSKQVFTGQ